jgi:hypothetical protein
VPVVEHDGVEGAFGPVLPGQRAGVAEAQALVVRLQRPRRGAELGHQPRQFVAHPPGQPAKLGRRAGQRAQRPREAGQRQFGVAAAARHQRVGPVRSAEVADQARLADAAFAFDQQGLAAAPGLLEPDDLLLAADEGQRRGHQVCRRHRCRVW